MYVIQCCNVSIKLVYFVPSFPGRPTMSSSVVTHTTEKTYIYAYDTFPKHCKIQITFMSPSLGIRGHSVLLRLLLCPHR